MPRKGSCSRDPSEDVPRSSSAPDMFRRNRTGDVRSAAGMAGFSASSSSGSVRTFQLSPSSVLKIQKGDITVWSVDGSTDAIVNATSKLMLADGGMDEAIHRAAGPELLEACRKVPKVQNFSRIRVRCPTGEARITPAFRLPVSHVIHTVGPIYYSDEHPEISLTNAYRNSLKLAKENNVQYIAFPAISCGLYRYPFKEASRIVISVAKEFPDSFKEGCNCLPRKRYHSPLASPPFLPPGIDGLEQVSATSRPSPLPPFRTFPTTTAPSSQPSAERS